MASFIKLEDSPMFRKQLHFLETTTEELKDRCQKLYKGCKKFMAALGEACEGDAAFAESLEAFGGGRDDPVSVSVGGPVLSKFITAFRELGTYKEFLRSQVEHMLSDRLMQFMTVDLQDAKESRQRFDKATHAYDQARERFMSLKKGTRADIVAELEEDLQNSKSAFERCRFNLVNVLTSIEAKKKFEFLESISATMDAHLRYFKLGFELFSQMEPFIHQVIIIVSELAHFLEIGDAHENICNWVKGNLLPREVLTYALQSKEMANIEQDKFAKRIQEFRTQVELDNLRASTNVDASTSGDSIHSFDTSSHKSIEALMQSTANGEVQTIKQGYLLNRSSNLRGDWKRRFFVLDSHGTLYYYRLKGTKPMGPLSHQSTGTLEHGGGVFGRFRARYQRASLLGEENLGCRTVNLRMSTIKIDAEHTDLRLCFRIISPSKTYTLQAENEADRMEWVDKIRGVITSLLNSPYLEQDMNTCSIINDTGYDSSLLECNISSEDEVKVKGQDFVSKVLREIPGNDLCAECGAPEPEWASLNLGILLCIECSGVHRNLGVHVSKVRSIKLDVKVWEPTILDLFHNLGNAYCNSVWEESLQTQNERRDEPDTNLSIAKPDSKDAISKREKYIQSKYVEKLLVVKEATHVDIPSCATRIWEAVKTNNVRAVYRLIAASEVNINICFEDVDGSNLSHLVNSPDSLNASDPAECQIIKDSGEPKNCLQGHSLLHLACHVGDPVMVEMLLQLGADINMRDFHGRTPLHHCIFKRDNKLAKYLLRRGARSSIKDGGGLTAMERTMEMGAITDEKLFILLAEGE
ncbi:hypothetical protein GIB67_035959 [Kingdonia uniflora]|uniref:Uncharacterized protein n=1 Tax=Kingdonia uniflora TaxID=39325 RepID=A0A7J7N1F2_9MAGN|nr:hypothetical protein GIB67_035959 [Kingdonia uniflora]